MRVCFYHEDRPGVGVCMRCRVVICAACCTRLQGVNHCHKCLQAMAARPERAASLAAGPLVAGGVLLLGVGVLCAVFALLQGTLAP